MRKLVFIGFVFPLLSWAQNLVPNPSFEDQNYCAPAEITNFGISGVLMDWYNPNTCTPDYFNNCWMIPPPINWHYQIADGDGFIGLCTYTTSFAGSNIRDYASCTLLSTLLPGRWYDVSFYARVKHGQTRFASNNLGIHFSDTMLHANNPYVFNLNTPPLLDAQVKYFNNEIISDSAHWTLVRGLYQAHGGEQYLTLGNFNTDAQTTQGMEYTDGIIWQTYFVIDMVSVIPLDNIQGGIPAKAGADTTIFINDTAFIGQKISNMPSNWYLLDGTPLASNTAGLYVSPQETTTYVVSHTLNGIFSADTVTVTVIDNLGLEEYATSNFSVFPNPNKGVFMIRMNEPLKSTTQLIISDNTGRILIQQTLESSGIEMSIETTIKPGVYFLLLQEFGKTGERKSIVIE